MKTVNILLLSFPACGKMHSRIQYLLVAFQKSLFIEKVDYYEIQFRCFE